MSKFRGEFYTGDDITLKGRFESDGIAQTPDADSAKCSIFKKDADEALVGDEDAFISGTTIYYKHTSFAVGEYVAYLTATFNSGADKRTGEIKFAVKAKTGIW